MLVAGVIGIFILVAYAGYVQAFEQNKEIRKEIKNKKG